MNSSKSPSSSGPADLFSIPRARDLDLASPADFSSPSLPYLCTHALSSLFDFLSCSCPILVFLFSSAPAVEIGFCSPFACWAFRIFLFSASHLLISLALCFSSCAPLFNIFSIHLPLHKHSIPRACDLDLPRPADFFSSSLPYLCTHALSYL